MPLTYEDLSPFMKSEADKIIAHCEGATKENIDFDALVEFYNENNMTENYTF
tara:strand:- start:6935 stop:7090 length:156 start_codon:yes stop_codon:yes gene_type:complete